LNNFNTTNLTNGLRLRKYKAPQKIEGNNFNIKDQTQMPNLNESLRFDVARLEAKVDIVLQHIISMSSGSANKVVQSDDLNAAELSLLRNMTTKQHVVLQLLIQGLRNQDIAPIMGIGENTVKLHVRSVCKKIGVKTRGQAAMHGGDILNRADPDEYQKLSGGIPLEWATTFSSPDQYAPLYAAQTDRRGENWAS
jgi:DNA-binding CsgD family transcriptional regulator